jgi:septal ring factor EnvC (AmiA/AmiB activator)
MSNNQDSLIKEANELLEIAQKEVLKEINNKQSFLTRLFAGQKSSEALKQAQSSISKAINQMKNFTRDESSIVTKLQNHLNDKTSKIKKLEDEYLQALKEKEELADKLKTIQSRIDKLQDLEEANSEPIIEKFPHNDHKLEEDLKSKIQSLEETNRELENKFILTKEDFSKSQALIVEFSKRMKRLKSEITVK